MKRETLLITSLVISLLCGFLTMRAEEIVVKKRLLWNASDRKAWTITASSSQTLSGNESPSALIDGNASTFWHSTYGANIVPGVTIDVDFGKTQVVTSVLMQQRSQINRQVKNFTVSFKAEGGTTWTQAYSGMLTESTDKQTFSFSRKPARYMRITIGSKISGDASNVCLAELGAEIEEAYVKSEVDAMMNFLELPVNSSVEKTTQLLRSEWSGTEPGKKTATLTVLPTSITTSSDAASKTITLSTNISKWSSWKMFNWLNTTEDRTSKKLNINISENTSLIGRTDTVYVSGAGIIKAIPVIQKGIQIATSLIPTDTYIKPSGGQSTDYYSSSHTISNLWDRNPSGNNYHSAVNNTTKVKTETLEFYFSQIPSVIDYFINYHSAGSVDSMTLSVKTGTNTTYTLIGKYPYANGKFIFPSQLQNVSAIKIELPVAPNGGLIAIKELEFWANNHQAPLNAALLKVFTDLSCSAVKTDALQADIDDLPQYFKIIANKMISGTYSKEYRIDAYEAYSDPDVFAKKRNTNAYSILDNPTGIYANSGDSIYVLVGDTHGSEVSIFSVSSASLNRDYYLLKEGINKIKITRTGLLYIKYFADLTQNPQPVNIHIPEGSGIVNGYWDVKKNTGAEWSNILNKSTFDVIDIVGHKFQAVFYTDELRKNLKNSADISKSVEIWDAMVNSEWKLMGFDKYPLPQNNRMCGICFDNSSIPMWATWYTTGYNRYTLIPEVLYPGCITGNKLWGMGHETGHCNQHPFDWKGNTESSNNTFAQVALDEVIDSIRGISNTTTDINLLNNAATDMEPPVPALNLALDSVAFYNCGGWEKFGVYYQLYLYFHKLGINPDFYKDLFESLRINGLGNSYYVAERQLNFYIRVCETAKTDFTEFFQAYGFFTPYYIKANQYGEFEYNITKEAAEAAISLVKGKNYPEPKYRIQFLHKHGKIKPVTSLNGYWTYYRDNAKIRADISCTVNTTSGAVTVSNGKEAAAFAVETNGKIVLYSDRASFTIPANKFNSTTVIYALPVETTKPLVKLYPKL